MTTAQTDYLVAGSGMGGLACALKLAEHGRVTIVTKKELAESNTNYAQGGVAAVLSADDTFESHIQDTLQVGDGLCHEDAVRILVENGPEMINELIGYGVDFARQTSDENQLDLGREGGHSRRRIAHAKDLTGAEIERALVARAISHKNIHILENHMAVDLVSIAKLNHEVAPGSANDACLGAYVIDSATGVISSIRARATILATGGVGKAYLVTSNPDIASGDGVAMAYRLGAKVANLEFMQFHPTCLFHPMAKSFLISEAVRGEGAQLRLKDGSAFMKNYHQMGSLAPRDIVARAIDREMKRSGADCVFLDTTMIDPAWFPKRFPNIYANCMKFGMDPTRQMLPVAPAAHYMCGGVVTDTSARTSIPGLFAVGETAHTGVHGANRLASNSLLEAVVFADRAAKSAHNSLVTQSRGSSPGYKIPAWDYGHAVDADEQVVISHIWDEIRMLMWNYVGIARTDKRLARAKHRIDIILREINDYYWDFVITTDLLELRNLALCARLIIQCAMTRKESRGLHYNLDWPKRDDENFAKDTVISTPSHAR